MASGTPFNVVGTTPQTLLSLSFPEAKGYWFSASLALQLTNPTTSSRLQLWLADGATPVTFVWLRADGPLASDVGGSGANSFSSLFDASAGLPTYVEVPSSGSWNVSSGQTCTYRVQGIVVPDAGSQLLVQLASNAPSGTVTVRGLTLEAFERP